MELKTSIKLDGNEIKVETFIEQNFEDGNDEYEYAFYIYYYSNQKSEKSLIYTGKYVKQSIFSYKVKDSGYYYVRCFAQNAGTKSGRVDKFTDTVLFIDNKYKKEFESKMKSDLTSKRTINDKIPFCRIPYPQNDFCLISIKKDNNINIDKEGLKKWCGNNKFVINKIERRDEWNTENILIYTDNKNENGAQCGKKTDYIFSGYIYKDDKFYFGQDDIPDDVRPNKLYERVGCYTLLAVEEDRIRITEDYYAYGGLYYYKCDDFMVITNIYHILLFILSYMGRKYELDEEQIYTMFASNVTLFRTPFTNELIIKNSYKLNLCYDIVIDKNGWNIEKRPSYYVLSGSKDFLEDEYNKLILDGKQELINNVKAVLENKKFSKFVLELSGGKDSRVTLAALTNVKDFNKKIKVHSTEHEPNDLNTAVGIVNMFNLEWNDYGYNFIIDDTLENIKRRRSCFCGMRYLYSVETQHTYDLEKLVFNSDSFEGQSVRYYADTIKGKVEFTAERDTLIDVYSKLCSRQSILGYNDVSDIVKKRLAKGMDEIPGSSPMEKFDNLFLCFRGCSHAGNLDRMYYTSATANAVQSKALLKAKKMWFHNFEENKIVFDILYVLNPVLASLPFNSNKYNEGRKKIKDKLFFDDIRFKNLNLKTDTDKTKYNEVAEIRKANTTVIYDKNYTDRGTVEEIVYDNCLLGIKKFSEIMDEKYKYSICLPLYYYINAEKDDDVEVNLIHNKINSIIDCIDAIGADNVI